MRKAVLMMICVLICLVCFSCKPSPDYYAALQYEWLVTEKPSGWKDLKYVFTADKQIDIYHTDGVNSWIADTWKIEEVDSLKVVTSTVIDGKKYEFEYFLKDDGTLLTIKHYFGAEYVMKFSRK